MKEDEEFCKNSFNKYLVNNLALHPSNWKEGENPPDYYLTLSNQDYAVEITTIMMRISSEPKDISQQSFQLSLRRLTKDIEKAAKEQKILSGKYCVRYNDAFDNFRQASRSIKKRALDYINNTKNQNNADWKILFRVGRPLCEIKKLSNIPNKIISAISSPKYIKWEGGIQLEACELIQKCLYDKVDKLKKINLQKIILLFDRYLFSEPIIFRNCKFERDILNFYHSIFIVEPDGGGYFVHSKEKSWL